MTNYSVKSQKGNMSFFKQKKGSLNSSMHLAYLKKDLGMREAVKDFLTSSNDSRFFDPDQL